MNDPASGVLDNDQNGDGIPDFVFPIREIPLKVKMFESVHDMDQYIKVNDSLCFGISIEQMQEEYHARFHFDDSTSPVGRTQSNIPPQSQSSDIFS